MLSVGLRVLSSISYHYLYEKNGIYKFINIFGSNIIRSNLRDKGSFLELCENMIKPKCLTLLQACTFIISGIIPCLGYVTTLFVDKKANKYFYIKELNNYLSLKMALNIWPMFLKITLQGLLTSRHLSSEMSVHKDNLHPIAECCISITSLATHFLTLFTIMIDNLSRYEIYFNLKKGMNTLGNNYPIPLILINSAKYIRIESKKNKYYDIEKAIRTILLQLTDCSVCDYENYVFNHYMVPQSISSFLYATRMNNDSNLENEHSSNNINAHETDYHDISINKNKALGNEMVKTYQSMYEDDYEQERIGIRSRSRRGIPL